ncbi:hypothetical protein [Aliivibrio fischeri]|uniref:hypothetical protein n=1 Tax=Aliivibrio fischeri TaxID=668 RepID=UPI00080DC23A|nr:hypothetical protein [Aliivibrio fischeri]OCH48163.1 hypothetical protein A6E02_08530 [Aliivibrio fischeri]
MNLFLIFLDPSLKKNGLEIIEIIEIMYRRLNRCGLSLRELSKDEVELLIKSSISESEDHILNE